MNTKPSSTRSALAGVLLLLAGAVQADHRYGGGYGPQPYGWYPPPPVYVAPPPVIYSAPVYPAPVYVPPPMNYAPIQPGLTVGIPPFYLNLPLGGGWGPRHHHHHRGHW
jgi:hypothetical protein